MNLCTESLRQASAAVCARDGVDVTGLPVPELLELSGDVARLRRDADVLMAEVSSEIRRRSDVTDTGVGLAARQGFRSAGFLVAQVTGGSVAQARRLIATGDLLAEVDATGSGDDGALSPLTRFRSELAGLVREGRIGVDAGTLFSDTVATLPDVERTRELFSQALSKAVGLPLHQVRRLVWQAQAHSDVKAWEAREHRQHELRSLTIQDGADGMVTFTAKLTPLAAAPVRAVLDAGVRWAMQQRRDDPGSDPRTAWQMRADILTDLCQHALDCTHATSGVKTTVIVRMSLEDMKAGSGVGEIDGIPQPISVSQLRQAAADAEVIPAVLGGKSEILDWGRAKRLFTQAQRLALVERDDGCAWCNAPPSWCTAHHIRWWDKHEGPTNLSNGVLLCTRCHTRTHQDGWDIHVRGQEVTFTPPASVDPARTPRIGGRKRHYIAA